MVAVEPSTLSEELLRYNSNVATGLTYLLWTLYGAIILGCILVTAYQRRRGITQSKYRKWASSPVFGKRHASAIQLCGIDIGTMPTNDQALAIVILFVLNGIACIVQYKIEKINAHSVYKDVAMRTGLLSFANLPLVIGLAGRNNVLALTTGISRCTWTLVHRWVGRLVILLALTHTVCCMMLFYFQHEAAYVDVWRHYWQQGYIITGTIAMFAGLLLFTHSFRFLRDRWHEVFIVMHVLLVIVFIVGSYLHERYAQNRINVNIWLFISLGLLSADYVARFIQLIWLNVSFDGTSTAHLTPLEGVTQIELRLPRNKMLKPGTSVYVTFPKFSLWQAHPFTIVSTTAKPDPRHSVVSFTSTLRSSSDNYDYWKDYCDVEVTEDRPSMKLLVKAKRGMTRRIYNHATRHPYSTISAFITLSPQLSPVQVTHPTVLLFAVGVGITPILPFMNTLLSLNHPRQKVSLIWIIRDYSLLSSVDLPTTNVTVFITDTKPFAVSHTSHNRIIYNRPNITDIINLYEVSKSHVISCATSELSDALRQEASIFTTLE